MNIFIDHLINLAQEPNIGEMIKGKKTQGMPFRNGTGDNMQNNLTLYDDQIDTRSIRKDWTRETIWQLASLSKRMP